MQIACENLTELVSGFSLVLDCDKIDDGAIRIATPFTYPNGSHIDVFLKPNNDLFQSFSLSDYGQTAEYLLEIGFDIWKTRRRRQLVADVSAALNVRLDSGAFVAQIDKEEISNLPSFMVKLVQACIRIADLSFINRLQNFITFDSEVEEFLTEKDLAYEPDIEVVSKFNKPIKLSFAVAGQSVNSLVQTLSTRNPTTSHITATEVFRKWFDLAPVKSEQQFVTIYDNNSANIRDEDLYRLDEYSTVLGFPNEREQIAETLAA